MNLGYSVLEAASNNQISRKGLPKFRRKTQRNLESPLFQTFSTLICTEKQNL